MTSGSYDVIYMVFWKIERYLWVLKLSSQFDNCSSFYIGEEREDFTFTPLPGEPENELLKSTDIMPLLHSVIFIKN